MERGVAAVEQGAGQGAAPGSRRARAAGVALLVAAGLLAAVTRVSIVGHWYGLYLLVGKEGPTLELKDDLLLGDGSRLVASVGFGPVRRLLEGRPAVRRGEPWLDLDWDEREGSGVIRNHLADGTELATLFSRYEDSVGLRPHGLFVGGALPEIAADPAAQNESGMTYRDARGWTHVWCNVNEAAWIGPRREVRYPSQWTFLGSRVLIREPQRVVLESAHETVVDGARLRMDRFAYFRAGKPYFKLGLRIVNVGDLPASYTFGYGDEPWVGEFGSAAGNVGWTAEGIVAEERAIDPAAHRWAGILDLDTQVADFVAWVGGDRPDLVYFSNQPGFERAGAPLASNEVFIGLEWRDRTLAPGESRDVLLSIGMAERDPATGRPRLPAGAGP